MTFQKDAEELKNRKPTHPNLENDDSMTIYQLVSQTNYHSQECVSALPIYLALMKNESNDHNPPPNDYPPPVYAYTQTNPYCDSFHLHSLQILGVHWNWTNSDW